MHYLMRFCILAAALFVAVVAFAQGEAEPVATGAAALVALAMALNTGGVYFLVNALKMWLPSIRLERPQWLPIIAMVSGPALNWAASVLGGALDYPLDFSPVIGILGGTAAVTAHQVRTQRRKR